MIEGLWINLLNGFKEFDIGLAVLIFTAYVFVDGLYAYYTLQVVNFKAFKAASIGALMHFLLAFGVINYVQNYLYIIPLALGSWLGTYLVVRVQGARKQD